MEDKEHDRVEPKKLQLRKFDPKSIKKDQVVVMLGKRNTGISYLCKDLLPFNSEVGSSYLCSKEQECQSQCNQDSL